MSHYMDFTIERKIKNKWVCVYENRWEEELQILNPYILKSVFWNTDNFKGFKEKSLSFKSWKKFTYPTEIYKEENEKEAVIVNSYELITDRLLKQLNNQKDTRYCLVGIPITEKNVETMSSLFHKTYPPIEKEIKTMDDLRQNVDKLFNIWHFDFTYFLVYRTPYEFRQERKKWTDKQLGAGFDYLKLFEIYKDDEPIKHYEISPVKISTLKDIEIEIKETKKALELHRRSNSAKKLMQSDIAVLLANHEDDIPELKKLGIGKELIALSSEDSIWYDWESIEPFEETVEQLELLAKMVGENGRLVWYID